MVRQTVCQPQPACNGSGSCACHAAAHPTPGSIDGAACCKHSAATRRADGAMRSEDARSVPPQLGKAHWIRLYHQAAPPEAGFTVHRVRRSEPIVPAKLEKYAALDAHGPGKGDHERLLPLGAV